ncbi:MAG TPA: APC family permease [Candidatus Binatia bacterium]|jgi:amino acid transporter|nr:APC family permease [Candidatus Binatia bacterium]
MPNVLKRLLVGRPLKTAQSTEERLTKRTALAVFSSDALSSVAYATDEILLVLVMAGSVGLGYSLPVAAAIIGLMLVVVVSYGQTIRAYPSGGGAYIVAKDNLGRYAGLIAGASLLVDYILTVAVSITAGVAAVTSAFPSLYGDRVEIGLAVLAFITLMNLRGIRESGRVFAVPAYVFIASLGALILVGLWRAATGTLPPPAPVAGNPAVWVITPIFLLRAFAAGCTALTGIEAISNGVQAFKKPETKNARITLFVMGALLACLFLGVTALARRIGVAPLENETVISQLARAVFGRGGFYFLIQAATAVILLLAANTSFADFPRLSSIMAKDRYLPVQLINLGDRLVYSNGIILLAAFSGALIFLFGGDTHRLIPLYAVGVFIGFSLSQFGMVRRWYVERGNGWLPRMLLNLIGGLATLVVLVIVASTKFTHGAWAVIAVIPLLVAMAVGTNRHYKHLKTRLSLTEERRIPVAQEHIAILFVSDLHKGTVAAARYAKGLRPTFIKALHIAFDEQDAAAMREKWTAWEMDIPLIIAPSPYRQLTEMLVHYVQEIERQHPAAAVTVVIPEFVCPHWWQLLLHNQTAARIKSELLHENVAVVSVPIQLAE